jgi:hypothetical protein
MEIGRAVKLLAMTTNSDMSITQMNMDSNIPTLHAITHSFKEELIVPYIGIEKNIEFFLGKGKKQVVSADGILANVISIEEKHICDLEDDITRIYGISPWEFIKRWHGANIGADSMIFAKLKLEKVDNEQ